MEISDDHIIELIKGQATTAQAVTDLKGSVEKGFKFIIDEHGKLDERVSAVEKKVWYGTGIGAALGIAAGWLKGHAGH